jgi:hypothetical protein
MAIATIKLTTAGVATGPFDLYSNLDSFAVPFATGVTRAQILAGYQTSNFPSLPSLPTIVRVKSTVYCVNYLDINVTPLTTTTAGPTTTTTTTAP